MRSIKWSILLILLVTSFSSIFSQEADTDDTTSYILLKKELSMGLNIHSHGWGFEFRTGNNVTAFRRRMLDFSIVSMKAPKEIRTINPYFNNSKSYIYGKMNHIYVIRGGITIHNQLNRKPRKPGGVEVRYYYGGGPSLALAKPIYLYIINFTSSFYEYQITTEKYNPYEHFIDNIYGRASFFKGFTEMKFYPGAFAKLGFSFDYTGDHYKVRTIEAGAILDLYPMPVPIMAFNEPNYFFLTFYAAFHFGHRYNRKLEKEDIGL